MSLRYIDVLPSNISTTANAGYSQGSPLVQFVIGAQDAFLLGSTIRLNGQDISPANPDELIAKVRQIVGPVSGLELTPSPAPAAPAQAP